MKTMQDVLECAMYTTRNYKSDIFLKYSGHTNGIALYAQFNGWAIDVDSEYFCHQECLENLSDNDIDKLATEMIEWIETNRILKDENERD